MGLQKDVGRVIRQHRERAGLTQVALADAIDRSVQTISLIERGQRPPNFEVMEAIARVLGIAVRDLFPGEIQFRDDVTAQVVGLLEPLSEGERKRVYRTLVAMLSG